MRPVSEVFFIKKIASSAVCVKLASNDNFAIVVREIENFETHVFKISVSICISKHCSYFVIEPLHRGIGHLPETPESLDSDPMLQYGLCHFVQLIGLDLL